MSKFYVSDGLNKFLIDTNTHLQACSKALSKWEEQNKVIGKNVCFGLNGFESINKNNCIETKIIRGLNKNWSKAGH